MQSDDQCCKNSVSANSLGVSVGEGRELITTPRKPFFWGSQRFFGGRPCVAAPTSLILTVLRQLYFFCGVQPKRGYVEPHAARGLRSPSIASRRRKSVRASRVA